MVYAAYMDHLFANGSLAYVRQSFVGADAWKVVEHLALDHGVLVLPGNAFAGSEEHVRISFANVDVDGIKSLAERMRAVSHELPIAAAE